MSISSQSASYQRGRTRLREWMALHTPKILTNYPFEVLAGVVALLMGLPFILGVAGPATLVGLVGSVAFHAWSAALALGGGTILLSLRVGDRPQPMILAAGLQLAGGAFAVYAIAVVVVAGTGGFTAIAAFTLLALLSMVRAMHFRRVVDIQKGARRIHEKGGTK